MAIKKPEFKTLFGRQLEPIMKEHPILYQKFEQLQKDNPWNNFSQKRIIEKLVEDFEYKVNHPMSQVLPFSIACYHKLKAIL